MRQVLQRLFRSSPRLAAGGEPSALDRATALAAGGRYREAIALLMDENRRQPSVAIEQMLVRLRQDGYAAEPVRPPTTPWPPPLADPFPGLRGVPEVPARELSGAVLGGAILHHGALIVRGLVPEARVQTLVEDIDRAVDAYDAAVEGRTLPDLERWFTPFVPGNGVTYSEIERRWGRQSGGQLLLAESPRALFDLVETYSAIGVVQHIADFLGEWPALSFQKSTLRRTPPTSQTEWHQDGAFLGAGTRTVNVWLACSHCGVDAPSIDLVARRLDGLVETGTGSAAFKWSVAREVGDRVGGDDIVRPVFAPGDALLVDHLSLHRTGVGPGMTRTRYAVESWFFAPSTYPDGQTPILF